MFKKITVTLFFTLLGTGSIIQAQENNVERSDVERKTAVVSASASSMLPLPEVKMSAVDESQDNVLMTADTANKQKPNTTIVAGSCLVVDLFVQQFCASNPNDISCQFQ